MATTTNFGFNTPDNTAYVKDGASAMRTLGNNIDARFGNVTTYPNQLVNVVSGVSRPIPFATAAGVVACGANAGVTITYPSGRFSQTPMLGTTCSEVSTFATNEIVTGKSGTTGFNAYSYAGSCNINYVAIQMTSASGPG